MHTPRFSGHPSSAGDFVLIRTFSRPLRTNCANVGTALSQSSLTLHYIPHRTGTRCGAFGFANRKGQYRPRRTVKILPPYPNRGCLQLATEERLTRFCGAGAPFRPLSLFAKLLPLANSENLPRLTSSGQKFPDEFASIWKSLGSVKYESSPQPVIT